VFGPFLDNGIGFEEVRRMTLHDVAIAQGYWRRNPPLRVLISGIAVAMGIPAERLFPVKTVKDLTAEDVDLTPKKGHMTFEQFERHMAATGGKIEGIGQM
jgi:hypothetical protein